MARAKYNRPLGEFAALYHLSLSGLNKLVARGKRADPPELPPFDQPEKMADWYRRHFTHAPPPRLLELAEGPPTASEPPAKRPSAKPPTPPTTEPPPQRAAVDMDTIAEMDLVTAAAMQRKKVAAEWLAYNRAQADRSSTQQALKTAADRYDSSISTLAKIEAQVTAAEAARGDRPHLKDIRAELGPLIASIATLFTNILIERAGLPRERAIALAAECFRDLTASRFAPAVALAA